MAKAKFERTKPHCNIGTIGHVDLPGQDPDPSRIRRRSGIRSDPELPGYGSFHDTGREHGKWNRF